MMNRLMTFAALAAAIFVLASCENKLESTYTRQEENIESIVSAFVTADSTVTVDYRDGSVRVTVVHGEGEALESDGAVSFYYAGHVVNSASISNGNLFVTNYEDFANSAKWSISDTSAFRIKVLDLSAEKVVTGLQKGLVGVKSGDECYVLFSGKHGFGSRAYGRVPQNSALAYHLWIKSVSNK